ncbi:MAG: DUF975 family protein [Lachnospiraceae bacterium]|nr:DUF975 family protein [Lachnospiraceae bacterium]
MIIFAVIVLVAAIVGFAISAFLLNPIETGCKRFFHRNLTEDATVSEVLFSFDHHYMNVVKTLFFRDLYIFLWTLLFIIPGIVKSYEYMMIPYLLSENPEMSKEEAFAMSKSMMQGQKWKAFVLNLSFLGWEILSIFTCGLLSIFYVNPYRDATLAALYDTLKNGNADHYEVIEEGNVNEL